MEKCDQDGNWADDEAEQSQPKGKPALKSLPGYSDPFVELNPVNLLIHEPGPCPVGPDCGQAVDGWDESTDNRGVSFGLDPEGLSLGFHVVPSEVVAEEEDDKDGDDHEQIGAVEADDEGGWELEEVDEEIAERVVDGLVQLA